LRSQSRGCCQLVLTKPILLLPAFGQVLLPPTRSFAPHGRYAACLCRCHKNSPMLRRRSPHDMEQCQKRFVPRRSQFPLAANHGRFAFETIAKSMLVARSDSQTHAFALQMRTRLQTDSWMMHRVLSLACKFPPNQPPAISLRHSFFMQVRRPRWSSSSESCTIALSNRQCSAIKYAKYTRPGIN
jgi:hypothetical protein